MKLLCKTLLAAVAAIGFGGSFAQGLPAQQELPTQKVITLQLSKVNWRTSVVFIAAAALIIGIIWGISSWRHRKAADPLSNLGPGVYQPAQSGETIPLPPASARH